jgi:hypothetical protein
MIEHPFELVNLEAPREGPAGSLLAAGIHCYEIEKQRDPEPRNTDEHSGVYSAMKRFPASLVVVTLRTGILVGLALLLILVLLPAAVAAQAAGLR